MPAVVFGPDRVIGRGRPRTGLVLGAGGVLGAAWMTGALVRLQERLPVADVDLLVGTSAGSVLAAALRCRASLDEIVAWQCGDATGMLSESMVLAAQDGPLPPWPQLRPGSLPLARAALLLHVPPWVGASGWLPHGRGRHEALRSLVGALQERHRPDDGSSDAGSWADGRTWIVAMDYDTGHRVLFGHPGAPRASLADAVVASCSIPGWYEPARIGGRRYVDGGVRSATSLGAPGRHRRAGDLRARADGQHRARSSAPAAPAARAPGQADVHPRADPSGEGARRAGQARHGRDAGPARPRRHGRQPDGPPAQAGRARGLPARSPALQAQVA